MRKSSQRKFENPNAERRLNYMRNLTEFEKPNHRFGFSNLSHFSLGDFLNLYIFRSYEVFQPQSFIIDY